MDKKEIFKRAISRLNSLSQNTKENGLVHEKYVTEYHLIIKTLEESDINLEEFKIPESELTQTIVGSNYVTGEIDYGDYRDVDGTYFTYKLESLLNYLKFDNHE